MRSSIGLDTTEPRHPILFRLEGGDRRSIGQSNEVVADVLADPSLFAAVFAGMLAESPLVRMRSADAIEKITRRHPEYLLPYKTAMVEQVARIVQQEVRWHVAQKLPRLEWSSDELAQVLGLLLEYLDERSSILRTCAMQALADLARCNPTLRPTVVARLQHLTGRGTPAMRARGRKLLATLGAPVPS